jgi:hypothetical protein
MADAFKVLENNTNLSQANKNIDNTGDPAGEYPKPEYFYRSSIRYEDHQLSTGGGDPDIDIADIMASTSQNSSDFTEASVKKTKSGHVFIFDDAGGEERILLKHKNGTGIEMRQDGTIIMRAENNIITSVGGSSVFMIEGDLKVSCKNIEVDATGDLDMRVGGDYNLNVGGDKKENITGSVRETIGKNKGSTVTGNESDIILGTRTNTTLGDHNNIIKGNYDNTVGGDYEMAGKGKALITSMTQVAMSSPDINIGAADLSILAAGGTIGGENVINYAKNYYGTSATFTAGVTTNGVTSSSGITAPTFHGALNGNALTATQAGRAGTAGAIGAGGSAGTVVNTATGATDTTETGQPTAALMKTYLTRSNQGVQQVLIDEGNHIKDKINIGPNTGFITEKSLTTKEIRAKLKDPAHNTNKEFINTLYAENRISEDYLKKLPTSINRSFDGEINYAPHETIGSRTSDITLIQGSPQQQPILPDKKYDPMSLDPKKGVYTVNLKTLLGVGIPISTFLIGTTLGHLATIEERQALARQLLLQAEVIKYKKSSDQFKDYQLVVTEGVYKATAGETLTPGSVPFLAQTGRAIAYEMYDERNRTSPEILFNFATRLAENLFGYDKIIIDYDKIDPNSAIDSSPLNVQVIIIMPEVDEDYNIVGAATPNMKLETRYNNQILSNTDLVEHNGLINEDITFVENSEGDTVRYDYSNTKIRNKPVKLKLIKALAAAVKASGVDFVTITSGLQPGTTGRRIGSARHDSGLAADLHVTYKGRKLDASKILDQAILTLFVKEAVKAGIKAGGMSKGYMGNFTMHLDMLGTHDGKGGYNGGLVTWRSDPFFVNAFKGPTT